MSYARRVDRDHARFISTLQKIGWAVVDTHALPGFVDAVCYRAGILRLVEFKTEKGTTTPMQKDLHRRFPVVIVRSLDDCLRLR